MSVILISLMALYNQDSSILNATNFPLPTGVSHDNLDPLLLAETAELELLYPEPSTLKTVIKAWATVRGPAWTRMITALTEEYNPLHNYDRQESWTDEHENEGTKSSAGSSESSGSGTDQTQVAGFNDATNLTNKDKLTSESSGDSSSEYSEETSDTGTTTRTGRVQGNIGVTTSAQMLAGELEIRQQDIYKIIVREFIKMFCLGVY